MTTGNKHLLLVNIGTHTFKTNKQKKTVKRVKVNKAKDQGGHLHFWPEYVTLCHHMMEVRNITSKAGYHRHINTIHLNLTTCDLYSRTGQKLITQNSHRSSFSVTILEGKAATVDSVQLHVKRTEIWGFCCCCCCSFKRYLSLRGYSCCKWRQVTGETMGKDPAADCHGNVCTSPSSCAFNCGWAAPFRINLD